MKKISKLKGAKTLGKNELKTILGGIWGQIGDRCSSGGSQGFVYCAPGLSCINLGSYTTYHICGIAME